MPNSSRKRVVIVGSSFAGLTAALELKRRTRNRHEIIVIDPRPEFTFIPSLIWVPFRVRSAQDVTFPLAPLYARKGIRFINETVEKIDPVAHAVTTSTGEQFAYDRLLIGTGPRLAFEKVPGLGPHGGHTHSVCNLEHALLARDAWDRFLLNPGPVVIGTAQGGSCFGASYEFMFNVHHQIRKAGLQDVAPVTFVTAEPFLGHFGLGGVGSSEQMINRFFDRLGIQGRPNTVIKEARGGEIELDDGTVLPSAFSMIVPPFTGVDAVRDAEGLGNPMGFIPVDEQFRHTSHADIFAAGVAIAIAPPYPTAVPAGVPKTGQMTETMAKVAVHNIAADIDGSDRHLMPIGDLDAICILDAGNNGVIFKASHVLGQDGNGKRAHVMTGPQAHWAKVAFEHIFLSTRKRGVLAL